VSATPAKICQVCKQDCSAKPRTKDANGLYFCNECLAAQKAQAAKGAAGGAAQPAARPVPQTTARAPTFKAEATESAPDYVWGGSSSAAKGEPCPSCASFLKQGALICTQCGFNTAAGRRLQTRISKEKTKLSETTAGRAMAGGASLMLWLVVGGIACVACLAGWIALGYYAHIESGLFAILVGVIIGAAVAITGQKSLNSLSGLIAAGYTFFVVAGWKIAIFAWLGDKLQGVDDSAIFIELAWSALWAFIGCGAAYKIGSYGLGAR
jgi:hypothetical protein